MSARPVVGELIPVGAAQMAMRVMQVHANGLLLAYEPPVGARQAAEVAPFRPQLGMVCRDRAGRKIGPLYENDSDEFPLRGRFNDANRWVHSYRLDGTWAIWGASNLDLIDEWRDDVPPAFQAGQTVRVSGSVGRFKIHNILGDRARLDHLGGYYAGTFPLDTLIAETAVAA